MNLDLKPVLDLQPVEDAPATPPKASDKKTTANVKLDPYQEAYLKTGMTDPSREGESDFIKSVASDPVGFVKSIPQDIAAVAEHAGAAALNIPAAMYRSATEGTADYPAPVAVIKRDESGKEVLTTEPKPLPFQPGEPIIQPRGTVMQPHGNPLEQLVSGFLTPGNIATFPFAATKPAQAFFLTQTAPGAIDAATKLVSKDTPSDQRRQAATDLLINSVMSYGLAKGLTRTKGEPNASRQQQATEVHGDVQPQPVPSPGEVPAQESGPGIQPQTTGRLSARPGEEAQTATGNVPLKAETLLARETGSIDPQEIATLPEPEYEKLTQARTPEGKAAFVLTQDATQWALNHPDADVAQLETLRDQAFEKQKAAGHTLVDRTQWFSDAIHALKQDEIGKQNIATVTGDRTGSATPSEPIEQPEPELVGMGGAVPGEFKGGNPDIYGIAARVREERAKAGQVAEVPAGEGIAAKESVEHGRDLLNQGADAEKALAQFEQTKKFSSDDMALVRAKGEQLAQDATKTEIKYGTDSDQYRAAWKALSDWDTRSKAMQTEWHKSGQAQQGETDIDTGTFTGLQRAFKEDTGKDFTPEQAGTAKKIAKRVTTTTDSAKEAVTKLYQHLDTVLNKDVSTDAEKQAVAAAHKTVREAAARLAEAENKTRVADAALKNKAAIQEEAIRKALAQASKTVREAAAKSAKEENKARVAQAGQKKETGSVQEQTVKQALAAASKTVRDAAIRAARKETADRLAQAAKDKRESQIQAKAAKAALDAANKAARQAATRLADAENKARIAQADKARFIWSKAKAYIDQGVDDFHEVVNKLATDLGMKVDDVRRELARPKGAKRLTDEAFKKQTAARRLSEQAKLWLKSTAIPGYQRALQSIPRVLFGLKVGFHGTVALGTHAPAVAFQPRFWNAYVRDFGKMYRMVAKPAYYEAQVQDLLRRPNYITGRRAGLVNDPFQWEDYNSPDMAKYIGRLSGMGNRGYFVLKILRQDMFDQHWNKLPKTAQVPEVAQAIADGINHATGVVKSQAPRGASLALFAPRLEASRVAWLYADPLKAADTFLRWNKATQAEKIFATNQLKEKAWVAGTLLSLLSLNQGVLSASGSKQKVNFTNPMRSDFLKFKVAGMDFSYGNAMTSMARLPIRLIAISQSDGGKLKNLIYPDEEWAKTIWEFARSQASPFADLSLTLATREDQQGRQLPSSNRPEPKRLQAKGIKPYTWAEFWTEQFLPIPAEEAAREVWQKGMGMNPQQVQGMFKALATIAIMGGTGARLTEDTAPR